MKQKKKTMEVCSGSKKNPRKDRFWEKRVSGTTNNRDVPFCFPPPPSFYICEWLKMAENKSKLKEGVGGAIEKNKIHPPIKSFFFFSSFSGCSFIIYTHTHTHTMFCVALEIVSFFLYYRLFMSWWTTSKKRIKKQKKNRSTFRSFLSSYRQRRNGCRLSSHTLRDQT